MATATSLQSLHRSFLLHHHHHFFTSSHDSISLKPTTKSYSLFTISSSSSSSSSLTTSSSSSSSSTGLDALAVHLSSREFRQADEETRRLLIVLAGEAAQKRGYVFFSEVQFIPAEELRAIDRLWKNHSGGRFGYSVQRRLWEKSSGDFTRFFIRVRWMKKLESEVEQYGYRSFPSEFMWDLTDATPEGHLPLTNALRGTQLLRSILTHPAFEEEETGEEVEQSDGEEAEKRNVEPHQKMKRLLNPDYSF
ncbi:tetrapyrrole-binding protein, chloroplastic [Curcuma longa]|uniref:tetrapyrrole-binding protein, chloroplastic n=1 Tax=Curcuma longa TaxID=136217 RepID=UPI003D9E936E